MSTDFSVPKVILITFRNYAIDVMTAATKGYGSFNWCCVTFAQIKKQYIILIDAVIRVQNSQRSFNLVFFLFFFFLVSFLSVDVY